MNLKRSIVLISMLASPPLLGIQAQPRQNEAGGNGRDFLKYVTAGDLPKVKEMLAGDPLLATTVDKDGVSAVLKAVYYRRTDIADLLVGARKDLNIFEASATGTVNQVRTMIEKAPSLANSYSPDGFTPLGLATFFGHRETVRDLLAAGAAVNAVSKNAMKMAALNSAAAARQIEIARLLLDRGANAGVRGEGGLTPLHEAAATGQIDLATLLLDRGADLNARAANGKTPLKLAIEADQAEMVRFLRKRGAIQ